MLDRLLTSAIHSPRQTAGRAARLAFAAGLFVAGIRAGAVLEYAGGSFWLTVALGLCGYGATILWADDTVWGVELGTLRPSAGWLNVALAVMGVGTIPGRSALAQQGREDRIVAAVLRRDAGGWSDRDLSAIHDRIPAAVDRERARRAATSRRAQAQAAEWRRQEEARRAAFNKTRVGSALHDAAVAIKLFMWVAANVVFGSGSDH